MCLLKKIVTLFRFEKLFAVLKPNTAGLKNWQKNFGLLPVVPAGLSLIFKHPIGSFRNFASLSERRR